MRSFFKIFFASLLALIIFSLLVVFFLITIAGSITAKDKPRVEAKSVLVLDLSQHYAEQEKQNPLSVISSEQRNVPGLYDVLRLINRAKTDKNISGIYVIANNNPNGFAASEELRNALKDFKSSNKFLLAHGDVITQKAYGVASVADKIYISPQGYLEWSGYNVDYVFLKGTLQKLEIEPQIFYAGKFKSATEPFRADQMTPENELQTSVWLNDLYSDFLLKTAEVRKIDTAILHQLANDAKIQNATDAANYKLVDGVKYDDQVKDEIKNKLGVDKYERLNFITINSYFAARDISSGSGEKIALIYAEGDIVDGKSDEGISAEHYRTLIRKARLDRTIKAIVFRVNSGGGSSMASETIWRELSLAKQEKPVVVSFGDVAASGGYYISCAADSIFALSTTITGSIGVFGIIPNMQAFFKNKLGVTFDGVKTAPYADAGNIYRPMNEKEKQLVQANVNMIYAQFKQRVADGRKKDTAYIDSIAQGRVWTGLRAKDIGLIDRFGGIEDAIQSAASMAKLKEYRIREYPEPKNIFDQLFGKADPMNYADKMKSELGEENYKIYQEMKRVKEMSNTVQARLPFQFFIH
ncbi:signal peptide peptidase SppA [Terrimonas pollutisoli]|uniref:signal peptide peptidase SppA n=1 Tax=Terrimonas pollutisoli TaxID=3034147 RepID=UPI0023ECE79E|nr:signal peptide peptidase SppA [Terrimonas sp. H1YJ31]